MQSVSERREMIGESGAVPVRRAATWTRRFDVILQNKSLYLRQNATLLEVLTVLRTVLVGCQTRTCVVCCCVW